MTNHEMTLRKRELRSDLEIMIAMNWNDRGEQKRLRDEYRHEVRELEKGRREQRTAEQEARAIRNRHAAQTRKYGLSPAAFDAMVTGQGGRCAACRLPFGPVRDFWPCVDHDHATGEIRGILCMLCNMTLGHAHDNVEVLEGLLRYLRRPRGSLQSAVDRIG